MSEDMGQEEHLLRELEKTGLPLEIEVSELLEKEWKVSNNQAYIDEDEGKTREIDIFAIHQSETDQLHFVKPPRLFLATDLAIECKRSESNAWVFPTRKTALPYTFGSGQTIDFLKVFSGGRSSFLTESYVHLPPLHYVTMENIAHDGMPL